MRLIICIRVASPRAMTSVVSVVRASRCPDTWSCFASPTECWPSARGRPSFYQPTPFSLSLSPFLRLLPPATDFVRLIIIRIFNRAIWRARHISTLAAARIMHFHEISSVVFIRKSIMWHHRLCGCFALHFFNLWFLCGTFTYFLCSTVSLLRSFSVYLRCDLLSLACLLS